MFIGRWQPFHRGHKKLIQKVLDEGKNVCVAIRDTPINDDNPLTADERKNQILKAFPNILVFVIPDIEEVCHGRKVGWGVREIRLDKKIEKISGTQIRRNK